MGSGSTVSAGGLDVSMQGVNARENSVAFGLLSEELLFLFAGGGAMHVS
jgi:hypothetical protein